MPYVPDNKMQGGASMALPAQNTAPTQSIQPTAGAPATAQGIQQAQAQEPQQQAPAQQPPMQAPPPPQPQPWRLSGNPFAPQLAQQIPTQPGANVVSRPLSKLGGDLQALKSTTHMTQHGDQPARLPKDASARAKILLRAFGKSATEIAENTQSGSEDAENHSSGGGLRTPSPISYAGLTVLPGKLASVLKMFNMERSGTGEGTKKPKIAPKWYREGEDAFLSPKELYHKRDKPRNGLHVPFGNMAKRAFDLPMMAAIPAAGAGVGAAFGAATAGPHNRMRGAVRGAGGGLGATIGGGLGLLGGMYGGAALEGTHPNLAKLLVPALGFAGGHLGMHAGTALADKVAPEEDDGEPSMLYGDKYAHSNNRLLKSGNGRLLGGLAVSSGVGAGLGALLSPKGHHAEGAKRGVGYGIGQHVGLLGGLSAAGGLAGLLMRSPRLQNLLGKLGPHLGAGAMLGSGVGLPAAGAVGGHMAAGALMGDPSWKSASYEKEALIPQLVGAAVRGVGLLGRGAGAVMRGGSAVARGAGTAMQVPGKALNMAGRVGGAVGRGVSRASTVVDDFGKQLMKPPPGAAAAKAVPPSIPFKGSPPPVPARVGPPAAPAAAPQPVIGPPPKPSPWAQQPHQFSRPGSNPALAQTQAMPGQPPISNSVANAPTQSLPQVTPTPAAARVVPPGVKKLPPPRGQTASGSIDPTTVSINTRAPVPPPPAVPAGAPKPVAGGPKAPRSPRIDEQPLPASHPMSQANQAAAATAEPPVGYSWGGTPYNGPVVPSTRYPQHAAIPGDISGTGANRNLFKRPSTPWNPGETQDQLVRLSQAMPAVGGTMNKAGDSSSRLRRMYMHRGESRGTNNKVRRMFNPHGESRRDPSLKLHRELSPHGEARMNEKPASALDPFAKAFADRCASMRLTGDQFELAVKRASAVHPEVAEALAPLTKEAYAGLVQAASRFWRPAAAAFQMGRKAIPLASMPRIAANAGSMGNVAHGAGRMVSSVGRGLRSTGQAIRSMPGYNQVNQSVRGGLTGGLLGSGVDQIGKHTGMYDTGGWGGTIGGMMGAGFRNPFLQKAMRGAGMGRLAAGGKQFFTGGAGGALKGFAGSGAVNPALAGTGLGTAQKALAYGATGGMALGGLNAYASHKGTQAAEQAMGAAAQQMGFKDMNEMAQVAQMMNGGDILGMLRHGWGKLDPTTQNMLIGGGLLGAGGLAAGMMGHGGIGAGAGLAGAGLIGAGLLRGGNRSGLYGGAAGDYGQQQPQNPIDSVDPNMQPGSQQPGGQSMPTMEPRNELEMQMG